MQALTKEECPKEGLGSENCHSLCFIVSARVKNLAKVSFGQRRRETEERASSKRET